MKKRNKILKIFKISTIALFLFLITLCIIYTDNHNIDYQYIEIIEKENGEFIKVVHLSDLHFPKEKVDTKLLTENIKKEAPDLICLTGDLINRDAVIDTCGVFEFIDKIKNICPIFYVTGNHEEDHKNPFLLYDYLLSSNIYILNDESLNIDIRSKRLTILGLNNDSDYSKKIYDDNPEFPQNYSILLAHKPNNEKYQTYITNEFISSNLILSGHLHGGQIRVFNKGILAPDDGIFPKRTSGLYLSDNLKKTKLVVSRGIGGSLFPFRINNKPHVIILNIKI